MSFDDLLEFSMSWECVSINYPGKVFVFYIKIKLKNQQLSRKLDLNLNFSLFHKFDKRMNA